MKYLVLAILTVFLSSCASTQQSREKANASNSGDKEMSQEKQLRHPRKAAPVLLQSNASGTPSRAKLRTNLKAKAAKSSTQRTAPQKQ